MHRVYAVDKAKQMLNHFNKTNLSNIMLCNLFLTYLRIEIQ